MSNVNFLRVATVSAVAAIPTALLSFALAVVVR
jgi:hypothetical protein